MLKKFAKYFLSELLVVLASKGRNDYDCLSASSNPTDTLLLKDLQQARMDPVWLQSSEIRK